MRFTRAGSLLLTTALAAAVVASPLTAQSTVAVNFAPGGRQLVLLDFSTFPLGPLSSDVLTRTGMYDLRGQLEIVMKDGVHMLRAAEPSTFRVRLPEVLPNDFTLEFDLIPKNCCSPQDLAFEGTAEIRQDAVSAHVFWHRDYLQVVGGVVNQSYDKPMPPALSAVVPGTLTNIAVSLHGTTLRMFTNGQAIYSLERAFARGRVLRVFLGGQLRDRNEPVYLARLRIAGGGQVTATNQSALSGNDLASSINDSTLQEAGATQRAPGRVAGTTTTTPTVTAPAAPGSTTGTVRTGNPTSPGITAATQPLSSPQNPLPNVGEKPPTESSTSNAAGNVPTAPTAFKVTDLDLQPLLQWAPVPNAVSYNIYRKEAGSPAAGVLLPYRVDFPNGVSGVFTGSGTVDPHLAPNVDMVYVVEAVFADGTKSPPSAALPHRMRSFLGTSSVTSHPPKEVVGPSQSLTQLNGATGSMVAWSWEAVNRHFGYGIAIDIVPNDGLRGTERMRDFLLTPPISDQTLSVSQSATTYSRAIPANSTVYFCYSRWRLDHPATAVPDLAGLFASRSGADYQNSTVACRQTVVPAGAGGQSTPTVQEPPVVGTPPNAEMASSPGALRLTPCGQRSTGGPGPATLTKAIGSPGGGRFRWSVVTGANYVIERAPVGTTSWTLIGSSCGGPSPLISMPTASGVPTQEIGIRDLVGGLTMGATVTYRITAIGQGGETGWNTLKWTVPCVYGPVPRATVTGSTVLLNWYKSGSLCGSEPSQSFESFTVSSSFGYTKDVTMTSHTIYGVPAGTHTFSVVGRWLPDGKSTRGVATVVVSY